MHITTNLSVLSSKISQAQLTVLKDFLATMPDPHQAKHGEKMLLQDDIAVIFINAEGSDDNKNVLEAHRKNFDLHFTLSGCDVIVSKAVEACTNIKTAYTENGDYILFDEVPEEHYNIAEGMFCLIPPEIAHMALYGHCGPVTKLVFKIPVQG